MGFEGARGFGRALLTAAAGGVLTLAAMRGLYATALLAALVVLWLAALPWIAGDRAAPPPPPPPPVPASEEERRRLTAYLDLSPAPLVALDEAGRLRVVNRAARRLLGSADLVADPPAALIEALRDTGAGRTATLELDDGGVARSFALAAGELALAGRMMRIGALIDIDAELKAAEATALRELIQVLSHEIVNALTPIASLADTAAAMLHDAAPDLPPIRDAVDTVARRAASLHRFGESYRALARLPAPVRARVPVAGLTADLGRLFATRWPLIALTIDTGRAPSHLLGDPDQLTAALWALLQNAAEASDGSDARILLGMEAMVGQTRIAIADNGPGIAAADRADIFRPFFTTKPAGTGVGLALVRQIVRGHGGEIVLAAADPGATRFEMTLPTA